MTMITRPSICQQECITRKSNLFESLNTPCFMVSSCRSVQFNTSLLLRCKTGLTIRGSGSVYLDHAGTTPYPKSLVERFAQDMTSNLFGNPHSASASSQLSTSRVEDTRLRALQFFNADPKEFDLVFVANATAGIKLVVEAMRSHAPDSFDFIYHQASHTSLVGVREEARKSLCIDDQRVGNWLDGQEVPFEQEAQDGPILFGYPGQSNLDGRRLPLSWAHQARCHDGRGETRTVYTLLDAASLVATSPLDLGSSETAPDFTVLSFYKIFGFPDLGALIVRRQAWPVFDSRRYFGGGTVDMAVCLKEQWHAPKSQFLHERLEDGTLPIHSIIALNTALSVHAGLFGSMSQVAAHVRFLSRRLQRGLRLLKHGNGTDVCVVYSPDLEQQETSAAAVGPIVAFNLRNHLGAWVSLAEFEKLAASKNFHLRTGGMCNPGGTADALGLQPWEMKRNFSAGFRCGTDDDILAGKPTGMIRASLGAMSTVRDVDQFVAFLDEFYRVPTIPPVQLPGPDLSLTESRSPALYVQSIWVYPIKSCGGFEVPHDTDWAVRPEGLAWDREWCLVHRGSGQALSQKRHPQMSLIRPVLDFARGELRITYAGDIPKHLPREISIPLSSNPDAFHVSSGLRPASSRVCGEAVALKTYSNPTINDFLSAVLGVPCSLARFPPGGQGNGMRRSKAQLQKHQIMMAAGVAPLPMAGSFPADIPSPPDSDSEGSAQRILLSNESPILAINLASVEALNQQIRQRGGRPVSPAVFRANVVIGASNPDSAQHAYAEDDWRTLRIGYKQQFRMLGSCKRCNMVGINQETAEKSEEPFVTLSKTRRFDGKVFFGNHMGHVPSADGLTREAQYPTIRVGDVVQPDVDPSDA